MHAYSTALGESPPPAPRGFFGHDNLIGEIIGHAENLTSLALVGAGGIGKTSISLTVLHHDRIVKRFGDNRRFIRCDQFPATRAHFLARLSKVIGAGIEDPQGLDPLLPFLSSKEIFLVIDSAESILDPQEVGEPEIFRVVEELGRFSNVCLCITSRVATIPQDFQCLDVPPLSIDAARSIYYRVCGSAPRPPGRIDNVLEQLGFHPFLVTSLGTIARQNNWNHSQLVKQWAQHNMHVFQTKYSGRPVKKWLRRQAASLLSLGNRRVDDSWLRLHNWALSSGATLSSYDWRLGPDHAHTWYSVCIGRFHVLPCSFVSHM